MVDRNMVVNAINEENTKQNKDIFLKKPELLLSHLQKKRNIGVSPRLKKPLGQLLPKPPVAAVGSFVKNKEKIPEVKKGGLRKKKKK